MASIVHHQGSEGDILEEAIKLEYDCIAAYSTASASCSHPAIAKTLKAWAEDHERHLGALRARRAQLQMPEVGANFLTEALNRAKVKLGAPLGLAAMLAVIENNAVDAADAYSQIADRVELPGQTRSIFANVRDQARQHIAALQALRIARR